MQPMKFSYPSADGTPIAAYRWDPPSGPTAAMQLTHGMGEHAMRHDHFAKAMTDGPRPSAARTHVAPPPRPLTKCGCPTKGQIVSV